MSGKFILWTDNHWAADYNRGVKGEIDEFDSVNIDGSQVAISDFLTSDEYSRFGTQIEERAKFLEKNLNRARMDLARGDLYRFSKSYFQFLEKNKTPENPEIPSVWQAKYAWNQVIESLGGNPGDIVLEYSFLAYMNQPLHFTPPLFIPQ
jgi:hypothetical protein